MKVNQTVNGKKVLGVALGLACAFALYSNGPALAESESDGFLMVGGGSSESGGIYSAGGTTESGGFYNSGSSTQSGGTYGSGAESESGGIFSTGASSESQLGHDSSSESGGQHVAGDRGYTPNYGVKTYKW